MILNGETTENGVSIVIKEILEAYSLAIKQGENMIRRLYSSNTVLIRCFAHLLNIDTLTMSLDLFQGFMLSLLNAISLYLLLCYESYFANCIFFTNQMGINHTGKICCYTDLQFS